MKAMVLCAGFGTRLGELTREIPKPMLDLNGRPMLAYIIANLRRHGFHDIAINLHFSPEIIREYFGDGSRFGVRLTYSDEPQLLGTAGGVKRMEAFFRHEESFLVHYGDVVTDQDLGALWRFHKQQRALATLLLHQRAMSNSIVTLDGEQRVIGFLERPDEETRRGIQSPWVNSGITICAPEILDAITPDVSSDLPRDVFPKLLGSRRVFGFPITGYRCAIDSPDRLASVRLDLSEGRCAIMNE